MVNKFKTKFNYLHSKHIKPHHGNKKVKNTIDTGVTSIGLFASFMSFPQVTKIYVTQNIGGLSFVTWLTALFASLAWFSYGIFYKSKPVIFSSLVGLIVNALMVFSFFLFT